jgi:hypothetical protein
MTTSANIAAKTGVSESTVIDVAESCARRMVEWFGNEEAAIVGLNDDKIAAVLAAAAIQDHMKSYQSFAVAVHNNPGAAALAVLGALEARGAI